MVNKEGLTMDFAVHSHDDERTTATLTQLVEILGTISNALGTGIDFEAAPITKKPTSKKVEIGTKHETDKSTLGNKSIPGMAISQAKPKITKANPYNNTSRDFTGLSISKEEMEEVIEENMNEHRSSDEKIAFGLGAVGARMGAAGLVNSTTDDEENIEYSDSSKKADLMSTTDGKELLSTLEEAVKKLEKFLTTTKVPSSNAMMPQDRRNEKLV